MTANEQAAVDQIERDRRRREAELLLLLLALADESEQHARYAVRLGADPVAAARHVWLGNDAIEQSGAAAVIAEAMADAEMSGVHRAYKLASLTPPPVEPVIIERLTERYLPQATETAARIWTVIEQKLSTVSQSIISATVKERLEALGLSFDAAQVTKDHPGLLDVHAERAIVGSHNSGMWQAFKGDPGHHLAGFVHRSIIDNATTDICRERDGLTLPADHPYWLRAFPPLHWGCRSVLAPLFGEKLIHQSETLPTIPPAPGFGYAPAAALGSYFGLHL